MAHAPRLGPRTSGAEPPRNGTAAIWTSTLQGREDRIALTTPAPVEESHRHRECRDARVVGFGCDPGRAREEPIQASLPDHQFAMSVIAGADERPRLARKDAIAAPVVVAARVPDVAIPGSSGHMQPMRTNWMERSHPCATQTA